MRKILKASLCLALVLALFTGCTVVNVAKVGEVNGESISLSSYKYMLKFAQLYFGAADYDDNLTMVCMYDSYMRQFMYSDITALLSEAGSEEDGKSLWEKELDGETVGDKLKNLVFDKAAELLLISQMAAEKEISLTEDEKSKVKDLKNSFIGALGSKTAFDKALDSINMTENELTGMWENILLADKLKDSLTLEDELTDDKLKAYYNDNYMRVKHILIKVGDDDIKDLDAAKVKADEVIKALDTGASFESLMAAYSGDVDSDGNVNGGETGYVFAEGDFGNPAFENASKELAVGEYTKEPVKVEASYSGYHIIKRLPLEESYFDTDTDSIKDAVKEKIKDAFYAKAMEEYKSSADVTKKESKIKGLKLEKKTSDTEE